MSGFEIELKISGNGVVKQSDIGFQTYHILMIQRQSAQHLPQSRRAELQQRNFSMKSLSCGLYKNGISMYSTTVLVEKCISEVVYWHGFFGSLSECD